MKLAEKIHKALSERVKDIDVDLIVDQLVNNEEESDEELAKFLATETSAKLNDLKKLIKAERSNFLGTKYVKNTPEENEKIIKKYIK